jgi:hypothetical protein
MRRDTGFGIRDSGSSRIAHRASRILFSAVVATNIAFSRPIQFSQAAQAREVQSVLPTTLGSAQLEKIHEAILERALFSARVHSAEVLQALDDILDRYLAGQINTATAVADLKQSMRDNGLWAAPGDEGTLKDFQSDQRLNLIIRMNAGFANGYGDWLYNQQAPVLDEWPAQELFRALQRKVPRDWVTRWNDAADATGTNVSGFVALRNTPIWSAISRFGVPYPPYDFNSGMRTRLVDRTRAMELGLIDRTTRIAPQDRGFNDDLKFTADIRAAALRQAIEEEGYHFEGDVLTLGGNA